MSRCILGLGVTLALLLSGCDDVPLLDRGPPPTPTSLVQPYDDAIATAEVEAEPTVQAGTYYERANFLLDQGNNEGAIADYTRAIELDPGNSRAWNNRGLAHANLEQTEQALSDYAKAIEFDPGYIRAYKNRLLIVEQQRDLQAMARDYGALAKLEEDNADAYYYAQGNALQESGDLVGARVAYDAAIAADPEQVDALYNRAVINFTENELEAARIDLDSAIEMSPRAANAYYARGLLHNARGDQQRAIGDFTRALELQPAYPEALLGRATVYQEIGEADNARADLESLSQQELDETLEFAIDVLRQQVED
ncbi:MAG: hypothetical protein GFH27_549279n494 [Chloroflexi bacterium AL-W]|nr:hypothetical protein [Chloroflexi bacterium AL-N1]NOK65459.1 hypothetical protein [Chloroflexi bacterium AL-N10]NOK72275.1 hypothetical protein [Chloroflexi bacterium AL-N5]NOK79639.1 hypothetical protein [Chloroflexi bacterium AL-W]NOK87554.1 hypothetical protein [Chloroflexi bacterium AL-N15]